MRNHDERPPAPKTVPNMPQITDPDLSVVMVLETEMRFAERRLWIILSIDLSGLRLMLQAALLERVRHHGLCDTGAMCTMGALDQPLVRRWPVADLNFGWIEVCNRTRSSRLGGPMAAKVGKTTSAQLAHGQGTWPMKGDRKGRGGQERLQQTSGPDDGRLETVSSFSTSKLR